MNKFCIGTSSQRNASADELAGWIDQQRLGCRIGKRRVFRRCEFECDLRDEKDKVSDHSIKKCSSCEPTLKEPWAREGFAAKFAFAGQSVSSNVHFESAKGDVHLFAVFAAE